MSVAVNELTETVSDDDVEGMEKAVTVGAVVSGSVIVTVALALVEILPAASFAQAYAVFVPEPEKV